MARYIILNTYSWLNKGDAAIVLGTVQAIRRFDSAAEVTVVSMTPSQDRGPYGNVGIAVIAGPYSYLFESTDAYPVRVVKFGVQMAAVVTGLLMSRGLGRRVLRLIPAKARELAESIAAADAVVSCGGGFWLDTHGGGGKGIYVHLLQVIAALAAGKPIVCLGQSLGPIRSPWRRWLVGRVLARARAIVLRESESLSVARLMKLPGDRIFMGSDMAFVLDPPPRLQRTVSEKGNIKIGVTARRWSFPFSSDPGESQARYEDSIVRGLDTLMEQYHAEVVFLPQVIGLPNDNDLIVEDRIHRRLTSPDRATVLRSNLSPYELMAHIGACDVVLATRFHAAIFSLLTSVPVVAIAYEHKTSGIMDRMGLKQWVLPIESVTAEQLAGLCSEALLTQADYQEQVRDKVAECRSDAYTSTELCIQLTCDSRKRLGMV